MQQRRTARHRLLLSWLLGLLLVTACGSDDLTETGLPDSLPFEFTRRAQGEPPAASETAAFTRKITGFWRDVDYFRWCTWHSHGLHATYDPTMPDYSLWWQDTVAIKSGDTVAFEHRGGADNLMIRTSKVLSNAIAGYLASGDPMMREIVLGYSKGIVALFDGLVYAEEDPVARYVTARAIFTHNHSYATEDGRRVVVDYDPVKVERRDWNAHTVPNQYNPTYGDIWVRNMRSKDDLPHMWRVPPLLMYLIRDTGDAQVRSAAERALEYLTGMGKEIVDQGYLIRTKEAGEVFVPLEEGSDDVVADLASFVKYDVLVPNAECNAKLTAALLGYDDERGNDCGNGINLDYEAIAGAVHYFNYAIIRYSHLASLTNALVRRHDDIAVALLEGLAVRADAMTANETERDDHPQWDADMASYLVASAASGLPLTAEEARIVQEQYSASADYYAAWPTWDLWDDSVPDGEYDYIPSRAAPDRSYVRPEEMTYLIEYCYSPWKNPAGVEMVDCDIVLDPSRWGT